MADVVVGVDGSKYSFVALRSAADEARCRSGRLHIVYVYGPVRGSHTETASVVAAGTVSLSSTSNALLHQATRRDDEERTKARRHAAGRLRQLVSESEVDLTGLTVEQSAVSDEHPAAALVRLSRSAELLVIGSRGLGGFAELLLGSVGQQCVRHAACSVLVARG